MIYIQCLFVLTFSVILNNGTGHSVSKRALLFPRATILQFNYGLSVPLVLPRRTILLSVVNQVNYNLPYDVSNFTPMTIAARKDGIFNITRKKFYKYIIQYLDSLGLEGEECLLKTICELAETPLHIKDGETLLEKIVHFIFTPSLDMFIENYNISRRDNLKFMDKLLLAETLGKKEGLCSEEYSECFISIIDLFTSKFVF